MISSSAGTPAVVSDRLCVVYERKTGRIIHMHRATTLEGGLIPEDDKVRVTALEHAARLHKEEKREHMETTFVDPKTYKAGAFHKIDLKTRKLIATSQILKFSKPRSGTSLKKRRSRRATR